MPMAEIERHLTSDEKRYTKPLNRRNILDNIKNKIAAEEQKAKKEFKPFCVACALADIEQDKMLVEMECAKKGVALADDTIYKRIEPKDFSKYSDEKYFDLLDVSEAMEHTLIGTTKVNQLIGYHKNYQCKKRGHGVALFVPKDIYEKEKKSAVVNDSK